MKANEVKPGTHTHEFGPHPNWAGHLACTVCGFAIPKSLTGSAANAGARFVEVKPGTRCECRNPKCPETISNVAGDPDRWTCGRLAVRLVTVRSNATVRLWDGSSVPAHDADHEYEVPLCAACAEHYEAKANK